MRLGASSSSVQCSKGTAHRAAAVGHAVKSAGLAPRPQQLQRRVLLSPAHCVCPSRDSLDATVVGPSNSLPQQRQQQQYRHAFASLSSDSLDSWDFDDHPQGLPGPANTPTNEDDIDDGELLYAPRRDLWMLTDQPGIDLLTAGPAALEHLQQVYVILFGVGERDTEGIYSLRAFSDDGLPQETIIVFEIEEDAQRYAGLLEATMDHTPNVCSIPPRELLDFCVDQGYNCRLEPCGSLLIPPDFNVGVTDWERSMRLRDGRWEVLEEEPERSLASSSSSTCSIDSSNSTQASTSTSSPEEPTTATHPSIQPGVAPASHRHHLPHAQPGAPVANASSLARYHPSFSQSQLQQIREKLEGLLPGNSSSERLQ